MRKTINCKIVRVVSMLLFSCFWAGMLGGQVSADEPHSIKVYSNVYNSATAIDAEFTYEVEPNNDNPSGAENEPETFVIDFVGMQPDGNTATKTAEIDYGEVRYQKYGLYRYTLREVASSNPEFKVSSEHYEIYVLYANTGLYVSQQAKNLNEDTKGNINFNHEPEYAYTTINLAVEGDEVDRQEYFRFKIYIDSLCIGCVYSIMGQDEYVRYDGESVKTSDVYTVSGAQASGTHVKYAVQKGDEGRDGVKRAVASGDGVDQRNMRYVASNLPNYIYLKHGQSVTIGLTPEGVSQIPLGTLVRVMGDENLSSRKWKMYIDGVETREFEHYVGKNIDFDIVLKRNMLVPNTGIFMEMMPYLLLVMVGGVGFCWFVRSKVRNAR